MKNAATLSLIITFTLFGSEAKAFEFTSGTIAIGTNDLTFKIKGDIANKLQGAYVASGDFKQFFDCKASVENEAVECSLRLTDPLGGGLAATHLLSEDEMLEISNLKNAALQYGSEWKGNVVSVDTASQDRSLVFRGPIANFLYFMMTRAENIDDGNLHKIGHHLKCDVYERPDVPAMCTLSVLKSK